MGSQLRTDDSGAGWGRLDLLLVGAAIFAAAEIAAAILIGRFFDWGRAEALLFFAFRPWLLLVAAMAFSTVGWKRRYAFYAFALLTAGLAESMLLMKLGASDPWPEMLRGWAAGASLVILFDLAIQSAARFGKRKGKVAVSIILVLVMLIPGALRPYERLVLGRETAGPTAERPEVTVMTSLPIIWGEKSPFDPGSGPSASWRALQQEFTLRPVDFLDSESLSETRLMLIAQPRQLSPQELVRLDEWVRGGGRTLILADPALAWPSDMPPGDVRRGISTNMLTPLLSHWRIEVGETDKAVRTHRLGDRQLLLAGSAGLISRNPACRQEASFVLDCRIGRGRAIVVADADLLHDSTSIPDGSESAQRHDRLSDNVPAIADWLDRLGRTRRQRSAGRVEWADPHFSRGSAVATASLAVAAVLLLALLTTILRRRNSQTYPQRSRSHEGLGTNPE